MQVPKYLNQSILLCALFMSLCACNQLSIRGVEVVTPACNTLVPFGGGDGTTGNPYIVCSKTQLDNVRNYLSSNFIQTVDLDISESDCVSFTPIGSVTPFSGTYDGQGHQIQNFCYHNAAAVTPVGLFSQVDGRIKNVTMTGVNVIGQDRVGALIGSGNSASVENSSSSGNVSGVGYVGGLIGEINQSSLISSSSSASVTANGKGLLGGLAGRAGRSFIQQSYATGNVTGIGVAHYEDAGGLIGESYGSTIDLCYATGAVIGPKYSGGLVADLNTNSFVFRSYSTSNVSGGTYIGGFVGTLDNSAIFESYATGTVTGTGDQTGGLVGNFSNASQIYNCFATNGVNGNTSVGGMIGYVDVAATGNVQQAFTTSTVLVTLDIPTTHAFTGNDLSGGNVVYNGTYFNTASPATADAGAIATGLTTANFTNAVNYAGYSTGIGEWKTSVTAGHPHLDLFWMP